MTTSRRPLLIALAATAAAPAAPRRSTAQAAAPVTLRLFSDSGPTLPYGIGAIAFAEEVERRTAGRVRVDLSGLGLGPTGRALGAERAQGRGFVEAVRAGDADLGIVSAAPLGAMVPELLALDLPFLFRDAPHARAMLDGPEGAALLGALAPAGLVGLAWGEAGLRHIATTKGPVRSPADLAGLRIRVQENPVHSDTFAALGAEPVVVPALREVAERLRDGRLDGMDQSAWILTAPALQAAREAVRHLSLTGQFYQAAAFLMSPAAWERVAPEDRAALPAAARAGAAANRRAVDAAEARAAAQLQEAGLVIETSPDRAAFAAALDVPMRAWRDRLGAERIGRIRATSSG